MSVLVNGMEMPKNCGECEFCHTENFKSWCCPTGRSDIFYDAIPDWCPLAEPKTGEWILSDNQRREDVENGNFYYFCSNCNHGDLHAKAQEVPYCWHCGAKMEG